MNIVYPEVFWLLIPVALLLLPAALNYRKGYILLLKLAGEWRKVKTTQVYMIKTLIYWMTIILFFVFSILALAGISWTKEAVRDDSTGLDIIFAVDISRSMLAADITADRLSRSGELISSLNSGFSRTRMGLVIFKGDGEVLVPLTDDRYIMETAVRSLSPSLYTVPGSDISRGITKAAGSFPEGSPAKKLIILITDGEALDGNAEDAARECYLQDISLFVVGAGTEEGSLIYNSDGSIVSDSLDQAVVTKLDRSHLSDIVESASGNYYDISDVKTAGMIIEDIKSLQEGSGAEGIRLQDQMNYRLFLFIALTFLVLNLASSRIRWSRWY
ncbi:MULTISPECIES: VWA domain-containing protein [unclassified Oceanispirochaeta]|uniref:vWA domain-containing protein n=1 Tax=unclassified Oceanispirochaeta TaxID=2635722 RepID=UPI000E09A71C|nr:VWA domain-containing protein [Oceanispirochaeta sp. M1]MBF9017828.1 VWA domain-containing protein [Oceanispirochaeta sp. M2]NPD74288.1 VWA domain-containing protein [Oceanispirochaeta sp. M1]RDG29878.1 VWA domain-containing protein [Oceanispirochaeta sp. M1]